MTEDDRLPERFSDLLARTEPAGSIDPAMVTRAGHAAVCRRRLGAAGLASLAVMSVTGAGLAVSARTDDARVAHDASVAAGERASFSADQLVEEVTAEVGRRASARLADPWVVNSVVAEDQDAALLVGKARGEAERWQFSFNGGSNVLDVILIYEDDSFSTEQAIKNDCESMLKAGVADTCEVSTPSEDVAVRSVERAAYRLTDGWPVVQSDTRKVNWYVQQAVARRSDGFAVYVTEAARASDLHEAGAEWRLTKAELQELALDPDFWFPAKP